LAGEPNAGAKVLLGEFCTFNTRDGGQSFGVRDNDPALAALPNASTLAADGYACLQGRLIDGRPIPNSHRSAIGFKANGRRFHARLNTHAEVSVQTLASISL
jgi:hypothetical protein